MTERRILDYRRRYWGHDFTLTPDSNPATARITGWGDGLRIGDLLIIPRQKGGDCMYEIKTLRWAYDPKDMWYTHCRFVPGSSRLGQVAIAAMDAPAVFSTIEFASWRVFDDGASTSYLSRCRRFLTRLAAPVFGGRGE